MSERSEEFMNSIGNDSPGHEFYDDVEFKEVEECKIVPADEYDSELLKYPIIKRYIKKNDDLQKLNDRIKEKENEK